MLLGIGERRALAEALERAGMELPDDVDVVWERDIIEDGVLGKFRWWRPDEIAIGGDATMIDLMAGTVAHELTHRAQFKRNRLAYWAKCVPGVREWALEPEARAVELEVDRRLGMEALNK